MSTPSELLDALGIRPDRSLGQHFLHDRAIVRRIVDVSGVDGETTVVEVGPGLGILTGELARRANRVIAIEKDDELARALQRHLPENVTIVAGDALEVDIAPLLRPGYRLVANLPYNVATAIIRRFLEMDPQPASMTVMVQREVAERMVASPPDMSLLAVAVQMYGSPRIAFRIGRGAFVPPPNVESAVVHLETHDPPLKGSDLNRFFELVRAGFSQRRKQLVNTLSAATGLDKSQLSGKLRSAGIDPAERPERLDVEDWLRLYAALAD